MEQYPSELTSPPVPLVALIGKPELHPALGDFLRSQNVPRVHSIGIPDAHSAAGTFGRRKGTPSGTTTAGILKAGWLRKHRTSTPAVAALLVDRASVVGDPAAWAWLVSQLDAVKAAARGRGARVVIVVAQKPDLPAAEVPEDRVAMICRQAGVERRCVLNFAPSEGLPALQVVGKVLHNQAVEFYMADAQRRLSAHTHRNVPSTDLNLRTAFKLGVLAEFRGDWAAALRMFREAYGYLPQVLASCTGQPQRYAEVRAVAEYVHVKGVSLLLLALKQLPEAVAQFEAHLRLFRRLPFTPAPGLLASHHAWLSRQYTVMAELVMSSGVDRAALKREQQPGQLYLAAALAAIERRKVAAFISGMHGGKAPSLPGRVEPGLFVGQLLLLPADPAAAAVAAGGAAIAAALAGLPASALAAAAGATKRLSEEQYELHLESEEGRVQHSKATVDLLHTAQDALRSSGRRTGKTLQRAMQLLGHELLESGNAAAAEPHLTQVAAFYRRERWEAPLASTLLLLRECRQQEHNLQAHTQLSLELAALSDSSLDAEQRGAMATAALSVLAAGEEEEAGGASGGLPASQPGGRLAEQEGDVAQQQASAGQRGQQRAQQQQGQGPSEAQFAYRVTSPQSGWLTVLPLCAGFFDPTHAVPPPSPDGPAAASGTTSGTVRFAAAVWNNAPVDLPLLSAEQQLCDASGPFTVALAADTAGSSSGGDGSNGGDSSSGGQPAADGLVLQAGAWLRLSADIPVRCSGDLQATSLLLRLGVGGSGSSITFQLPKLFAAQERPAAAGAAVAAPPMAGWLRGGWPSSRLPFNSSAGFLAGRCSIEVPPQHAPPLLVLQAPEVLLQGERAVVTLAVRAAAAHGILGSVLHCTAVHAESQEQLVLTRGDTDAAQPADMVQADTAHPAEQEAGQEQSGAEHAQQAAGLQLQLGDLAAGERRHLVLLLDARYRGAVHLSADLKYTAVTRGTAGTGHAHTATEAGHCTATLAVQVQLPWKLGLQLLGPPATHSLLSAAAEPSAAEGSLGSPAILLLDQQPERLQGMSVHDAPLPPSAASEAALGDGAKDLPALLLRSLPLRLVLPAGQRCTALVQLQSLAACQLDVLSMDMEPGDGVRLLPTAAVASDVGPAAVAACDTLCRSDVFAAAFAVASSAEAAKELPSLGSLRVTWRRHQPRPVLLAAAACGASQLNAAAAAAAAETETAGAAGLGGSSSSVSSPAVCELLVPLPPVSFLRPLLTAAMHYPAAGTAGQPSELRLQLRNEGGSSQEVGVAVGDSHGSLLAGPKSTRVQVPPHSSASLSWQAVPYHTGPQTLPEITVAAAQHGQAVDVTRGCSMFVHRQSPRQEVQATHEPSMEPGIV